MSEDQRDPDQPPVEHPVEPSSESGPPPDRDQATDPSNGQASDLGTPEPTQPLSGWPQPGRYYGQQPTHPMGPSYPQPDGQLGPAGQPDYQGPPNPQGPMPYTGYGGQRPLAHTTNPERRGGLPGGTWVAVAGLALLLGLVGGLIGASLVDLAEDDGGRAARGLDGVSTREAAPLDAENGSVPAVAQALLPSTVQIIAEYDGKAAGATGSGFVLDQEGHVVTNNHVVASAAEDDGPILVIDHEGRRHEASVVGRSPVYDLAVLLVDDLGDIEPAALGASQALRVGESVVAFGAPLGLSQTVTSGIVSALDRPVTTSGESGDDSSFINAVQTDAAINPGNSGGPLVNLSGEVVGVNSAIATTGGLGGESGNIGVGFAIPIEQVRTTVDQILRTGKAEYPVIGAKVRTGGEGADAGAEITEVMSDTPASRAGLKKDDVVTAVDGQPVTDGIALIVAIRTHLPGEEVEFTIVRGEKEQKISLTLDGEVG